MSVPTNEPQRALPFEQVPNFRDLGGYATGDGRTTRWGSMYRASHLAQMSEADQSRFAALEIGELFDLRRRSETEAYPNRVPSSVRTHVFDIDVGSSQSFYANLMAGQGAASDTHAMMVSMYTAYVTDKADKFGQFLKLALNARPGAILFHCMVGKDRTGVGAALLLSALGVPRETVIEDYLLTAREYPPARIVNIIEEFAAAKTFGEANISREALTPFCSVHEDYLGAVFKHIDQVHGSTEKFLATLGIGDAECEALQTRFLTA